MKKTALRKEFWMAVRKSKGRFLSIFFIVALGVAFFAGIRSSEPDMRISGDTYYDETSLMDLKVQGTMGITDGDIRALSEVDGIARAEGGYSVDVITKIGENEKVIHIQSDLPTINQITVSEGQMPKSADECLLDEDFMEANGYKVGDTIRFESGTEEALSESLKEEEFQIVGAGSSSAYISFERGSSLIGNGEIAAFAVVAPEAFSMEVYTEAYLLVDGAKELTAYTDEYDELVAKIKKRAEGIEEVRCEARLSEIRQEAEKTITESEKELSDAKKEADAKLSEAGQKIADSEQELADGKQKLADGRTAIADGKEEIRKQKQTLSDAKKQYESGKKELASGKQELNAKKAEFTSGRKAAEAGFAEKEAELLKSGQTLEDTKAQLDAAQKEWEKNEPQLTAAKAAWESGTKELEAGRIKLSQAKQEAKERFAETEKQLAESKAGLAAAGQQVETLKAQIEALAAKIEKEPENPSLEEWKQQLSVMEETYQTGLAGYETGQAELKKGEEELAAAKQSAEAQFAEKEQEITQNEQKLNEAKGQIDAAEQQKARLDEARKAWESGAKQLKSGKAQFAAAKKQTQAQLSEGERQLKSAEAVLVSSEKKLSNAAAQIKTGDARIREAEKTIQEKEAELKKAEQELADGEKELSDGKAEYEAQKKEAEDTFAKAEKEISDARKELDDIEKPEWYVNDRDVLTEYTSYGENADRMRAIGEVFPELFFLVAALISLTTMTRMVEEERTQIGTLKALGYGKKAIAGKYLMYAFLATLGGSILGVLIGEKLLPYIIIYSYRIMYTHLPHIVIPYQWSYAAMATAAALACTIFATLYACYKELAAQPAALMRPPAPKEGKRIFLERIGLIWKRLSFIWKSSIRNLFRYKKRLFMTLVGIGGCMALMVVGFGLKDSIMCIGTLQYEELQIYDGMVYLSGSASDQERAELLAHMDEMKNMKSYMEAGMNRQKLSSDGEKKEKGVYLCVVRDKDEAEEFMVFRDRKSGKEYHLTDDGIILTEKMAKTLGVSKGDTVYLNTDDRKKTEVTVRAVCENYMEHYVYMTQAFYEKLYGEEAEYNTVLFDLKDDSQKKLDQTGETLLKYDGVMNVTYTNSIADQLDTMLKSLNLVIVVLIISAGMLAFVVLYNLNNINITERRRELATLKVLGFYDNEVSSYVYRENIMLTGFSIVIGMGLGWLLHRFVITTVEVDMVMFGRVINWQSYLYSALFTIGFSLFVNWVMYYKLKKIDMVESLKSIE